MNSNRRLLASVATLALACSFGHAQAGGIAVHDQGAAATGLAYAGVGAGSGGLASMFWNPATMTDHAGLQVSGNLTGFLPYANMAPTGKSSPYLLAAGGRKSSGNIGLATAIPSTFVSYQLSDRVWIGMAVDAPFGIMGKDPTNWAGQIYGRTSRVFTVEAAPSVAVKVTDWLSVSAGLRVEYFDADLSQGMSPLPNAPSASIKGDGVGVGYTLGATIKPFEGTEIGVGYRSGVTQGIRGHLAFDGDQLNPNTGALVMPKGSYGMKTTLALPAMVTVGLRQRVTDRLTFDAGFEWQNWKSFNTFPVYGTEGALKGRQLSALGFKYRNGWMASVGAEYAWSEDLLLRAGVAYEKSPITDAVRGVRLPTGDTVTAALGASYRWNEHLSFDVAYAHVFGLGGNIHIAQGNPAYVQPSLALPNTVFDAKVKTHADIVSAGVTYRF